MGKFAVPVLLVLAVLAILGCRQEQSASQLPPPDYSSVPVVTVDDAHLQVKRPDGATPPAYEIEAAEGLIVDATGYQFYIPPQVRAQKPNMIQVLYEKQVYSVDWVEGQTRYALTPETLKPAQLTEPFTGFKPGMSVLIGIGYKESGSWLSGTLTFYALWYGCVNVR